MFLSIRQAEWVTCLHFGDVSVGLFQVNIIWETTSCGWCYVLGVLAGGVARVVHGEASVSVGSIEFGCAAEYLLNKGESFS